MTTHIHVVCRCYEVTAMQKQPYLACSVDHHIKTLWTRPWSLWQPASGSDHGYCWYYWYCWYCGRLTLDMCCRPTSDRTLYWGGKRFRTFWAFITFQMWTALKVRGGGSNAPIPYTQQCVKATGACTSSWWSTERTDNRDSDLKHCAMIASECLSYIEVLFVI